PKDVRALRSIAASQGEAAPLLECVENSNDQQLDRLLHTVAAYFGERLRFRKIAVWGLSFKPGTDDTRESPALRLVDRLLEAGATVQACDPAVRRLPGGHRRGFSLQTDPVAACDRAELLCVMTDWPQYQNPNWTEIVSRMDSPAVLDPHRLYNKAAMLAMGLRYLGLDHRSMAWTYSGMNSFDSALHRSSSSSAAP
ncbi:MAG TPA: UDP binding domain-containing protein, partial [Burkholderiaceae bacterium]|nr:UDP binding domain-containing protein [Burkholderiaceae bacterium]